MSAPSSPPRVRLERHGPDALLLLADHGARQRAVRLSYAEAAELAAELGMRLAEHQAARLALELGEHPPALELAEHQAAGEVTS